eukprot:gene11076-12244_t
MMPSYSPTDQGLSQFGYQGGFSFQKRHGRIDWKKLAAVDVGKITREIDIQTLQDNIAHVAFCDIENELSNRNSDPNFIKLFQLSQLLIEYLLHSQEYLQGYITQIESQMRNTIQDQSGLRNEIEKKGNAYKNLKREYQKSKKLIAEYQLMLRAGASGFHKCPFCAKSFLSDEFLKGHILRRHNDKASSLNIQPTQNANDTKIGSFANQEELLKELSFISTKLQETEARLVTEREERDRKFEASREQELHRIEQFSREQLRAKDDEIAKMKIDIESHKDMFLKEINELHVEKKMMSKQFQDFYEKTESRPSMLGNLQDMSAVDGQREEDMNHIKEQLQQELMVSYQSQLEKMNKAARRREDQLKRAHNEEIEKVTELLARFEETIQQKELEKDKLNKKAREEQALYNDRFKRYEQVLQEQKMKMKNMEEKLNSNRNRMIEDEEMIAPTEIQATAVAASTPMLRRSLELPQESQQSDETILLHVASNSKNIFRVWRTPSPAISEWKDTLSFRASLIEKGQFNQPIYVFYASGSPYWRQYVTRLSDPPRSCYKLDFKFYVSNVQLMGTTRYFVLDAGSGEVVKSMISKSEIYPGWKAKGLSFFALKGPKESNLQKSVSFQSTLNESEFESGDDVSVSSYTATDVAKKHLAEAITKTRSQENILEEPKEQVQQPEEERMEEDESFQQSEEESADEDEVTYDEPDAKLDVTGSSTSQWGSTLLQSGSFLPFPHNPMAVARYNHSKEMLHSCREEAIEILNSALDSRGVDINEPGITDEEFLSKMNMHENEVKVLQKKRPEEKIERQRIVDGIDRIAREYIRSQSPQKTSGDKSAKSKFKSAVNKIKNASIFSRSPRKKDEPKPKLKELEKRNSYINKSFDDQSPIQGASMGTPPPTSKPEADVNDEVFDDVSENSKWDSELSSELSPVPTGSVQLPKVTVTMPGQNNEDIRQSRTTPTPARQIRGEKVRELTASLEASLKARDAKKPAGAVDLHDTNDDNQISAVTAKYDEDYDDDDDDFSISSVEDEYMQPPSSSSHLRTEQRKPNVSPNERKPYGSSATLNANETAISKFTVDDDFDSDSDLGL